jgi:uncharacterized protein YndB with AHSA1/START domain
MTEARAATTVALPPERAFDRFTAELGSWWPPEYTWSQATLEEIGIEDGLCFERGPHGFRLDWGRVLEWERPERLVFTWQIGAGRVPQPDPAHASEVEVTFALERDGTRVEVVHRGFERHGDGAEDYAAAMASPQGWEFILGRFADT